jgi:hypothetical protein
MGKMMNNAMCVKKSLPVVGCVVVLLLYATPCSAVDILTGEIWNVDSDSYNGQLLSNQWLWVYGELNLKAGAVVGDVWIRTGGVVNMDPGAYVLGGMYIEEGTTVNFCGGTVGFGIYIFNNPDPQPTVTVFGTGFKVDGIDWDADEFIPLGEGTELTWPYDDVQDFSLTFYGPGNIPVQLKNPDPDGGGIVIDIKPGSDTNPINLNSKGLVPVAVLATDGPVAIDPATVLFAGIPPVRWTLEDVDDDGDKDMLFHFSTQDLAEVLTEESTEVTLTAELMTDSIASQSAGETSGGTMVSGTDKVQILPSKSKKK